MEAVLTQIGDKLGVVIDEEVVERENLKLGDRVLIERSENSGETEEMDPDAAGEIARQIIEANDELFRSLS